MMGVVEFMDCSINSGCSGGVDGDYGSLGYYGAVLKLFTVVVVIV